MLLQIMQELMDKFSTCHLQWLVNGMTDDMTKDTSAY